MKENMKKFVENEHHHHHLSLDVGIYMIVSWTFSLFIPKYLG